MRSEWKRRGNLYYRAQPGVMSALKRVCHVLHQEWDRWRFYRRTRREGSSVSS